MHKTRSVQLILFNHSTTQLQINLPSDIRCCCNHKLDALILRLCHSMYFPRIKLQTWANNQFLHHITLQECTVFFCSCILATCTDKFAQFTNNAPPNFASMSPTSSATSIVACQAACLSDTNCVGLAWIKDLRPFSQKCILYTAFIGSLSTTSFADFYARQSCQSQLVINGGSCA